MADTIKIGSLDISAFKVGSGDCKVYLGDTLLYPQSQPSFKWKATNSDSYTESAECDSSSAITQNEINKRYAVSVEIGDCVTSIGNQAFEDYSGLTSIVISDSVTSIGNQAFGRCSGLTNCTIGSGVTTIGMYAFAYCTSLTSIDIPDSVTSIDGSAFEWCSGFTSCTIGSGVTSIGRGAFNNCRSLTNITVNATTPPTLPNTSVFTNTNNSSIYVPSQSVSTYKTASGWSSYASRIQAIPNS